MEGSPPRLPRNPTLSLSLPRPLSLSASLLSSLSRLASPRIFPCGDFGGGEGRGKRLLERGDGYTGG